MFGDTRLKAKIDNFTDDNFAILDIAGLKIEYPKNKIPDGLGIGDTIVLESFSEKEIKKKDKQIAQNILDEILSGTSKE